MNYLAAHYLLKRPVVMETGRQQRVQRKKDGGRSGSNGNGHHLVDRN